MTGQQPAKPGYQRLERAGWRDQSLSERHGAWGFNCPAVDIDFLMVEYAGGAPLALVEYKHFQGLRHPIDLTHPSYRAIRALAWASKIPFIVAYYHPECWAFMVIPANALATRFFPVAKRETWISERVYVSKLYRIRAYRLEREVLERLNNALPDIPDMAG